MIFYLLIFLLILSAAATLAFSSLTYSLRDFSRPRLRDLLAANDGIEWYQPTVDRATDLIFATATGRLFANLLVLVFTLATFEGTTIPPWSRYVISMFITGAVTLFCSVAVPHAIARQAGERLIASSAPVMHALAGVLRPLVRLMHFADRSVGKLAGPTGEHDERQEQVQQDLLSVVEEGEKDGVVDSTERTMIEGVIRFRGAEAGDIMTPRTDIIGIAADSDLATVKTILEESGHSRIPVYDGSLDRVLGILYARDLLKHLGAPPEQFAIRASLRPVIFVPKSKPVPDLLSDFRMQKVHMSLVLDEHGTLVGLVTIEDVLEQLVGDISDEHEPAAPAMFKRLSDTAVDVDARMPVMELNRTLGLHLPEDEGFETLGGFVSHTLGRVPKTGIVFERESSRYTILDAEPNRVVRVKIDLLKLSAESAA